MPLLPDNTSKPWLQSAFPLHILARNGNPLEIEQLLIAGADVNLEDVLSTRPLHVAAMCNHLEAAKLFIHYGADIHDDSYYGITALFLAVKYGHFEMAQLLIQHGANPLQSSELSNSPCAFEYLLEQLDNGNHSGENIRPVIDTFYLIKNSFPELESYTLNMFDIEETFPISYMFRAMATESVTTDSQESLIALADFYNDSHLEEYYNNAKLLLHVLPTGNNYELSVDESTRYPFNSEGTADNYTYDFVLKSLKAYGEQESTSSLFEKVTQSYQLGHELTHHSGITEYAQKALDAYYQGDTLLLPSGWDGHFVNIILSHHQGLFGSANSGMRYKEHEAGVTFYKIYDPNEIDLSLIQNIMANQDPNLLEYDFIYQYGLLEQVSLVPGDNQLYGNCGLQSQREAIRGLLYVELLNEGKAPEEARSKAEEHFQEWNTFFNAFTVNHYFSNEVGLSPDAFIDIFYEMNKPSVQPVSKENHALSQVLINALMTPDYLPYFLEKLKDFSADYGIESTQHLFDNYHVDVKYLITTPPHMIEPFSPIHALEPMG